MLPIFFNSVLGSSGAAVMQNLAKASPELESYLSPRIIVSWLRHSNYGEIGVPAACPLKALLKGGYGYSGSTNIEGIDYTFSNSSEEHVAAVITVALGVPVTQVDMKDVNLAKLAKTIDLLCKAAPKAPVGRIEHAEPTKPIKQEEPEPPTPAQPKTNKLLKPPSKIPCLKPTLQKPLKITKSETLTRCDICGEALFLNGEFVSCVCFKPLAKHCKSTANGDSVTLTFDDEWDSEAYLTLVGILKKNGKNS